MLQPYLCDSVFLDLFSGSGAIGIEALSRGAKKAVFIEQQDEAIRCINDNLENTRLKEQALVKKTDVITGLQQLEGTGVQFDVVFMDPPYSCNLEKMALKYLKNSELIHQDTLLIFEAALDTDVSDLEDMGYEIHKIKKYKTNMHVFLYRT